MCRVMQSTPAPAWPYAWSAQVSCQDNGVGRCKMAGRQGADPHPARRRGPQLDRRSGRGPPDHELDHDRGRCGVRRRARPGHGGGAHRPGAQGDDPVTPPRGRERSAADASRGSSRPSGRVGAALSNPRRSHQWWVGRKRPACVEVRPGRAPAEHSHSGSGHGGLHGLRGDPCGRFRVEVRKRLSSAARERCVTRVLDSPGRIGLVFGMTSTLYI
jgi:hypothetical protein